LGSEALLLAAPMGLQKDAVDLGEVDEADAVAHGLEEGAARQMLRAARVSAARAPW